MPTFSRRLADRFAFAVALVLGLALAAAAPERALAQSSAADEQRVDLELVLLADATGSIDQAEIEFQRQGYADALRDQKLLEAMTGGPFGRIAVTYVEWADAFSQDVVVDWRVIDGPAAAERFAVDLMAAPRRAYGRNAIGAALVRAVNMIQTNSYRGERRVIDFSADSANNWNGPSIEEGRKAALDAGITINGLAVLCRSCNGRPVGYDLEAAFKQEIVGGVGAFVVTADSEASFGDAVRNKLWLEVSGLTPTQLAQIQGADAAIASPVRAAR